MEQRLERLGGRIRTARLRRRFTAKLVAERAGMSLMTLRAIERGAAGVTIGAYAAVLFVLDFADDLDRVGGADTVGRGLQDAVLRRGRRQTDRLVGPDFDTTAPRLASRPDAENSASP